MEKQRCYYDHEGSELLIDCYDEVSKVCARCCVEDCPTLEPGLFTNCLAAGHPTWKNAEPSKLAPNKLVCLEAYWDSNRMFHDLSVKPFLDSIRPLLRNNLVVGHRFVETIEGLKFYTFYPDGLLWRDGMTFNTPLFYLAFHGKAGAVQSGMADFDSKTLCEAFSGYGGEYDNVIYFSACGIFKGYKGEKFAKDFLTSSGTKAVFGFAEDVDWMDSMVVDLLFLERFYNNPDPFNNLMNIYQSIITDFKPAKKLGFSMFASDR